MPTYEDPGRDADELAEAARGLAYATRRIDDPAATYEVLGSLHLALERIGDGLSRLASWHEQHAPYAATDDGNRASGMEHAQRAQGWLLTAAASTRHVVQLVMAAHSENGRIAWRPEPTGPELLEAREQALEPDVTDREDPGPAVPPSLSR